jgi:PAS domain S-box-containing protein
METSAKTLLIVDDEVIVALNEVRSLEREGYEAIQASSGQEAIDIVRRDSPAIDLILMDINLGKGMDGTHAAREILKTHDIPVVFLSSHTEREIVEKTETITSYGYVVKDTGITVLTASIKMAFKLHKAYQELKKQEKALAESEERFRTIFDQSPIGAALTLADFRFFRVNQELCRMMGYSGEDFASLTFTDITHPDYLDADKRQVQRLSAGEIDRYETEKRYIRKDGTVIWGHLSLQAIKDPEGNLLCFLPMVVDITERKRAEEALRESEIRFRTLVDSIEDVVFTLDVNQRCTGMYGRWLKKGGHESEYYVGKIAQDMYGPEHSAVHESANRRALAGEYVIYGWTIEGDKGTRFYQTSLSPIYDSEKRVTGIVGIGRDVTGQKQVEEALRISQNFFNTVIEQSPYPMWISDEKGILIRINRSCCDLLKIAPDEVIGRYSILADNIVQEQGLLPLVREVYEKGETVRFEISYDTSRLAQIELREGSSVVLDTTVAPIKGPDGRVTNAIVQHVDITERTRADERIRLADERLQYLLFSTSAVIYSARTSADYGATFISGNIVRMTGYEPERFLEDPGFWIEHIHPEDRGRVFNELPGLFEKGALMYEYRFHCKDGSYIWVRDEMQLERDEDGRPLEIIGYWINITEQRLAQEALRESETRYHRITDAMTDYIYTVRVENGKAVETMHAPGCLAVTGYTDTEFTVDPFLWYNMVAVEDRSAVEDHASHILTGVETRAIEHRIIKKDGEQRWVRNTPVPHYDTQGRIISYDGLIQDITERKRAEQALEKSIAEKDVLLKELQHRVKNNLNVIYSLLGLEMEKLSDEKDKRVFINAQARIHSMSAIYEQLYSTASIDRVDLNRYIKNLAFSLFETYAVDTRSITIEVHTANAVMDIKRAIPVGLILNELIMNALRHAFPDNRKGKITIMLEEDGGRIGLSVSDDGIGFPVGINPDTYDSMGLNLIRMLSNQIGGEFSIKGMDGTHAILRFALE